MSDKWSDKFYIPVTGEENAPQSMSPVDEYNTLRAEVTRLTALVASRSDALGEIADILFGKIDDERINTISTIVYAELSDHPWEAKP